MGFWKKAAHTLGKLCNTTLAVFAPITAGSTDNYLKDAITGTRHALENVSGKTAAVRTEREAEARAAAQDAAAEQEIKDQQTQALASLNEGIDKRKKRRGFDDSINLSPLGSTEALTDLRSKLLGGA